MANPTDYDIMRSLEKTVEKTVTFAATGVTQSYTLTANALTHTIVVDIDDFTNASTTVLSILNEDGHEIYASSSLSENTLNIIAAEKPLVGDNTILLTVSGVLGGTGGDIRVTFYLQARGY